MSIIFITITKVALSVWLSLFPGVPDRDHHPIRRPEVARNLVAEFALTSSNPTTVATALDVLGARESNWDAAAVGDHGQSCGIFQTPCDSTPMPAGWRIEFEAAYNMPHDTVEERSARDAALLTAHQNRLEAITMEMRRGQFRKAVTVFEQSIQNCPAHPLWRYASGKCAFSATADEYERIANDNMQHPLPEDP